MPLSPKPAHADVVRNPKAPGLYAGWLAIGCPITTGSGTTIANIGYRTGSPWGSTFALVNTPTWGTEAGIGDKLTFNGTSQYVALAAASGRNLSFPRGTMMIWIDQTSTTGNRTWYGSGSIGGSGKQMRITQTASTNRLNVVHYHSGGAASNIQFDGVDETVGPYVLFVSWGERSFSARLFGPLGEISGAAAGFGNPSADTEALVITDGQTATLMANGPSAGFTGGDLFGFAWWDWQLPDRAIEELAVDPAVWMRPAPATVTDHIVPWVGRVTPTTATFRIVTSETLAGDGQFRILITDDWADFVTNSGYSTFTTNSTTNDAPLTVVANSLSIGTRYYWIAQTQLDSDGWFDMPCGMGQFVAGRAAGANFKWGYATDSHFNASELVIPDGYYRDSVGDILRFSGLLEDAYLDPPDFFIWGGDDYYPDNHPTGYTDRDNFVAWINHIAPVAKSCCMYQMLGNHEREDGSFQDQTTNTTAGNQRDLTVLRKKFIPNPTNLTYAEGGENDTNYLSNSGSDWVPALDGTYDATYRTNQIGNGADGNGPPLENFYGFNWGDGQWFILDPYRASQPGGDVVYTAGSRFRLGNWQKSWLSNNLRGSSYAHKHVLCHQWPGGIYNSSSVGGKYGRGSGHHVGPHRLFVAGDTAHELTVSVDNSVPGTQGDIDELWLMREMVDTGCKGFFKGHDHQNIIVSKYTVALTTGPSPMSALKFTTLTDFRDCFGDTRLEYHNRKGSGVVSGWAGYGYVRGTITGNSDSTIAVRETYHSNTPNTDYDSGIYAQVNHIGPIQTGTNGTLTLDETPRKVLCVTTDEEGRFHDGTFTTAVTPAIQSNFRGTNRYTSPAQITGTNATITGNSLSDSGIPDWAQVTGPGEYITLITVGGNTVASSYKITAVGAALTLASNPGDGTSTSWFINPLREPLASNAVAYDDSDLEAGSQSMRIDCYPRDIYTYTLGNAVPGSIPKDGIAQATPGGSRP